jgi:hypothetical protein
MSEKILIIGKNSKIAKEFIKKISKSTTIIKPSKTEWDMKDINFNSKKINQIKKMDKILLLQSVISSTPILKRKSLDILSKFLLIFYL